MTSPAPTLTVLGGTPHRHSPLAQGLAGPSTQVADEPLDEQDWSWVLAAPFRAHIREVLTAEPLPWRALAGYARVPDNVVRGLLGLGRRPLHRFAPHYAHALLSVHPTSLRADLVRPTEPDCALGAARALLAAGWTVARVARAGSLADQRLRALLNGEDLLITQRSDLFLAAAARAHGLELDGVERLDALTAPLAA